MTENLSNRQLLTLWASLYLLFVGSIIAYANSCAPKDARRDCAIQIKDALSPYQQQKLLGHGYTYRSALKWCHKNEDFNHQIETVQLSTPLFPH